jgi:hypothetical protein
MMSAANVLRHPAFEREPVVNPKTRGRPKGTASFRMAQRRKALKDAPPTRRVGRFMTELLSLGLDDSALLRLLAALRKDEPAGRNDD